MSGGRKGLSRAKNPRHVIAANFDEKDIRDVNRLLKQIPVELQQRQLTRVLRLAGEVVVRQAKANVNALARTTDIEERDRFPPIAGTINTVVRESDSGKFVAAFVGPVWPEGSPGHWIEYGFEQTYAKLPATAGSKDGKPIKVKRKTPKKVQPRPFLRPAADLTLDKQKAAIVNGLKRTIVRLAFKQLAR